MPRSQADLARPGLTTKVRDNLAALRVRDQLRREQRPPTTTEQAMLARFSSWGALAQAVFARAEYQWARDELAELLTGEEMAAARAATLNAHFTDAALVQQVWRAVTGLGFDGGQVLEPGCGTGNFIGFAPPEAHIVGVELDPVTAEITGWLYPQATVRVESFAKTQVVHGNFDATVGNVPFGQYVEHDPVYNPERFTIHNAFLFKAVQLTRPGGLVAVFTSRYTMDATDTTVRDRLFAFADLVGAVRLPSGAHRKAAGTDVVTDLLILRRREPGHTPASDTWRQTTPVEVDGQPIPINTFFAEHPQLVLGELSTSSGQYGEAELAVDGPADASLLLAEAIDRIVTGARAQQLTWTPAPADQVAPVAFLDPHATVPDRYLRAHRDGSFTQAVYGTEQPFDVPDGQAAELRALLALRDTVVELLDAEAHTEHTTGHIDTLRRRLNQLYDTYHARYGPINRTTATRTGSPRRPNQGGFRKDPYAVLVQALEVYDPDTGTATKAEIFHQRVEQPRQAATSADTPADALAICMDRHGQLRLPVIADLLGMDLRAARQALGTLVFDDPDTGALVLADEYLSGNVRAKHAQAAKAAATDPRYGPNVTALAEVIPTDIPPQEIRAQLGASWIDAAHVQQFLRETLGDPDLKVDHPGGSTWKVLSWRRSLEAVEQWGTPDVPAPALAEALLRRKPIEVRRAADNGSTYLDTEATAVAAAKASELDERFGEWVWEDPARAAELARKYNHEFNATRLRTYAGSYLTLPGLADGFSPRGHQNAAVERILLNPAVGLFHEVGAGKTSTMIMAAMEMRRLGLVNKPVFVTPKNVLQPFVAEFLERYPRARLLVGYAEDITPEQRRTFIARAATTSWDAVLMTRDAFEKIPMDYASRLAYLNRAVEEMTATTKVAEGLDLDEATVKELERAKKRAEERVEKLMDKARDDGIDFKQTGIDYVFADEAAANQGYKNLMTVSAMPGMSITPGSGRALDMHMKLEYLRANYPRVATLATATPITRSLAEIYNWMRYLDPQALHERAITTFDQFLATFTTATTDFELTVTGALKLKTRVNRIVNLPELVTMFGAVGDIKTAEDLQLPTPLLKQRPDGKRRPQIITVSQGPHGSDYHEHLKRRADNLAGRPEKGRDNHLIIVNDGKSAAVDLRLVGRPPDQPSKLTTVADNIARIWQETKDNEYLTRSGQPSPHKGPLQIVFCDLGVPSDRGKKTSAFVVYHELRDQLAARGIPREKIRYAHEAGNDERKRAALVDECNDGKVAVLIASTSKAGQGTNMQARAIALHHVDCTWNPSDLLQREGRIKRQGNQNPEIYIFNYVAEGSFDGYVYQTVERKARIIGPVLSGKVTDREIEDVGEVALSLAEVKALASGNPLLLELNQAERELARLERLERNHANGQRTIRYTITSREQDAQIYRAAADEYAHALTLRTPTRGDAFIITIAQQTYRRRRDAEQALHELVAALDPGVQDQPVGSLGGLRLTASTTPQRDPADRRVVLVFAEATRSRVALSADGTDLGKQVNIVARLENRLDELDAEQANHTMLAEQAASEAERANGQVGRPFRYADELAAARDRFTDLKARLAAQQKHTSSDGDGAAPAPPAPATASGHQHPATPPPTDPGGHTGPVETTHQQAPPATSAPAAVQAAGEPSNLPTPGLTSTEDTADEARGELSAVARNALTRARDPQVQPAARLVAYLHVPADEAPRLGPMRDDLHSIAEAGTVGERCAARYLLDRIDGQADHLSDAQRAAITAAAAAFSDPKPAERVGRYHTLGPQQFAQLPDIHREAIIADLRELAASNTPTPARRGAYGITHRGGLAAWVGQARTVLASLTTTTTATPATTVAAADTAPVPKPASQPAQAGLVIDHRQDGTVVRGTSRDDHTLHKLLHDHDFRWSQRKEFWYLPRPWKHSTRTYKVRRLTRALDTQGRTYKLHETSIDEPQASGQAVLPDAEPYRARREIQADYRQMAKAWTTLYASQAAKTMMLAHTGDSRPDGRALADAMRQVWDVWTRGPAEQAVDRLTDAAAAARTLLTNLTAARYHAPKMLPQLEALTSQLERFAARMATTAAGNEHAPAEDVQRRNSEADRSAPDETQRQRRGHDFYPTGQRAAHLPGLGATGQQKSADIVLYEHYFAGGMDWWIAEWDPATGRAFGYTCLGDPTDAEWGMLDLAELEQITLQGLWVVERDLNWDPVPAGQANLPGPHAPQPPPTPKTEPALDVASDPGPQPSATGQPSAAGHAGAHDRQPPTTRQPRDDSVDPTASASAPGPGAPPRPGLAAAHPTPPRVATGTPSRTPPGPPATASRRTPPEPRR